MFHYLRDLPLVGVIGPSEPDPQTAHAAFEVARLLAERGCNLVTGGLAGVMAEAPRGFVDARKSIAADMQGLVVGVLPGALRTDANPFIDLVIPTGIAEARDFILVNTSHVLIAIGKGDGTLVEIGYALRARKRVVSLGSWEVDPRILGAATPEEAVSIALK